MGSYKITAKGSVEKDLRKIDRSQVLKITQAMQALGENPFPAASKKLVGSDQTYRLRVGDYRIIYIMDEKAKVIEIQRVRHRKDVYR